MAALGKHAFFLLLAWCLVTGVQAQDIGTLPNLTPPLDDYRVERITAQDGLPASVITRVEQDQHGYLWFTGNPGLFRFDGYAFKTFQHDPDDATSIGDN